MDSGCLAQRAPQAGSRWCTRTHDVVHNNMGKGVRNMLYCRTFVSYALAGGGLGRLLQGLKAAVLHAMFGFEGRVPQAAAGLHASSSVVCVS